MTKPWLGLSIVVGLVFMLTTTTWADFQTGRDAYKRGDYEAAITEWRPLAEQGDANAQWWLGSMYEKGLGIPQDYEEAIRWFQLAAEQGNELAQNDLGNMYCCVKGVTEDLIQAHMWLNLASSQGHSRARAARNMLIQRMTPVQIVEAQQRAMEWKPNADKRPPKSSAPERLGKEIIGKDDTPMVLIPKGEFRMGSEEGTGDEQPVHWAALDAFYMDQYEVTTGRYATFLRATSRKEPRHWNQVSLGSQGDKPVVGVTWYDAKAYCEQYDKRLPTEAEWEKAARGTDGRIYPWGNEEPTSRHANFAQGDAPFKMYGILTPVGSKEAGKSPYGVYDMAGNVMEWVADWYDENYYHSSPMDNPKGPSSGKFKVFRGGSWVNIPIHVRSADRLGGVPPSTRLDVIGFRCAQDAP